MISLKEKLKENRAGVLGVFFSILFAAGVLSGGYFVCATGIQLHTLTDSVFISGVFMNVSSDWMTFFSSFLFDFLFFLLVVFLFGMTFLGVMVVPAVVFFKGTVMGISLMALLLLDGSTAFFRSWITYLPAAALSIGTVIAFSVCAFAVSLKACRFLVYREGMSVSLKSYWFQFFIALLMLLTASAVRCILGFLAAILF